MEAGLDPDEGKGGDGRGHDRRTWPGGEVLFAVLYAVKSQGLLSKKGH